MRGKDFQYFFFQISLCCHSLNHAYSGKAFPLWMFKGRATWF